MPALRIGPNPDLPLPSETKLVMAIFPFAAIAVMSVFTPAKSRTEAR